MNKEAVDTKQDEKGAGSILAVDDNPNNLRLLSGLLAQHDYDVRPAINGSLAMKSAVSKPPELILLDIRMPEMDGYEVCRQLKADPRTAEIPVLFISALEETVDKVKAFEVGGVDFISKPFQSEEVLARVRTHLSLHRMQRRLEEQNAQLERYREHLEELVAQRTEELRQARDKIGAILKSVPEGLLVTDMEGQIVLVNRSAERLFGAPPDDLCRRPVREVIDDEALQRRLARTLAEEVPGAPFELEMLDRGREEVRSFQVETSLVTGTEDRPTGAIIVLRDVTRERESDRLKSEFLSTAAHELNTPLTSIIGYSEFMLDEDGPPLDREEQRKYLATINEKGQELSEIINGLLQLSRIETGRPLLLEKTPCAIDEPIGELAAEYRAESKHPFEISLPGEKLVVEADGGKIRQALDNLFSNAVKFSPEGSPVKVSAAREGETLRILVEDEGIGMTNEQMEKAFEKFYRVDASTTAVGGFGLGLTIARNIVEAHGGRIALESAPGKGTRAVLVLPLKDEAQ